MDYKTAKKNLFSLTHFGSKLGLGRISRLCRALGNPQKKYKIIHVAGTNGKGSTSVFISNMLQAAGYKAGCYTSPHLDQLEERIKIAGKRISKPDFAKCMAVVWPFAKKLRCTFFEVITAVAFVYFARKGVDVAVLEVGLGGRFDATNIAKASVAAITQIDLEHTQLLGDTVEKIAFEKSGVIKKGSLVVTSVRNKGALAVIKKQCRKLGCKLLLAQREVKVVPTSLTPDHTDLSVRAFGSRVWCTVPCPGRFQLANISCAVLAFCAFTGDFNKNAIFSGLSNSTIPGRLETVSNRPLVVMDCAHNPQAFGALADSISLFRKRKVVLVFGAMKDKDVAQMISRIKSKIDAFVLNSPQVDSRALAASQLVPYIEKAGKPYVIVDDPYLSVKKARKMAGKNGMVLVAGSMYMLSQARHKKPHIGM